MNAGTNGASGHEDVIRAALEPLVDVEAELQGDEQRLRAELGEIRSQRKRIKRLLRDGGLLEPATKPKAKGSTPTSTPSLDTMARVEHAVQVLDDDWRISEVVAETGLSDNPVRRAIEVLRSEGKVRLVGHRQASPNSPSPAKFFRTVD